MVNASGWTAKFWYFNLWTPCSPNQGKILGWDLYIIFDVIEYQQVCRGGAGWGGTLFPTPFLLLVRFISSGMEKSIHPWRICLQQTPQYDTNKITHRRLYQDFGHIMTYPYVCLISGLAASPWNYEGFARVIFLGFPCHHCISYSLDRVSCYVNLPQTLKPPLWVSKASSCKGCKSKNDSTVGQDLAIQNVLGRKQAKTFAYPSWN